jgi:hypothetical protein
MEMFEPWILRRRNVAKSILTPCREATSLASCYSNKYPVTACSEAPHSPLELAVVSYIN